MRRQLPVSMSVPLLFLFACTGPTPEDADAVGPVPAPRSGPGVEVVSFDSLPPNHLYPGDRRPLASRPLVALPPGSIEARGWLRERLEAQARGLATALPEGEGEPAGASRAEILRALLPLGRLLGDETHELARREVERIAVELIANPATSSLDPALSLALLREYYRDRGETRAVESSVLLALRIVAASAPDGEAKGEPASLLAAIDALRWAFNHSGDSRLLGRAEEAIELLDSPPLARELSPAQEWLRTAQRMLGAGDVSAGELESAWTRAADSGTVGGSLADLSAEASMASISDTVLVSTQGAGLTALAVWPERLERVTFNALLGATTEDAPGFPRRVRRDQTDAVYTKGTAAARAWAEYGSRLWVAAPGDGLAALSYAPCRVRSYVGEDEGAAITLHVRSSYPFEERIEIDIETPRKVTFSLALPVPSWTPGATVSVNRRPPLKGEAGSYLVLRREWRDGDRLLLTLPMRVRKTLQPGGGLGVELGPLLFALPLDGEREEGGIAGDPGGFRLSSHSVPGGFALTSGPQRAFAGELVRSPLRIRLPMATVDPPASTAAGPLPRSSAGETEPRVLLPWGLCPLRLAIFPWLEP